MASRTHEDQVYSSNQNNYGGNIVENTCLGFNSRETQTGNDSFV